MGCKYRQFEAINRIVIPALLVRQSGVDVPRFERVRYPDHMGKRIFLFILTNLAIVLTLTIVASIFGLSQGYTANGLDLGALAMFCLLWGMGGASSRCSYRAGWPSGRQASSW
jgi:hypothetical protein